MAGVEVDKDFCGMALYRITFIFHQFKALDFYSHFGNRRHRMIRRVVEKHHYQ